MNKKMHKIGNNGFWRLFDWNGTMIMKIVSNLKKKALRLYSGFPGGAVVENLPANAGDTGSSPGLGRSHMPRGN